MCLRRFSYGTNWISRSGIHGYHRISCSAVGDNLCSSSHQHNVIRDCWDFYWQTNILPLIILLSFHSSKQILEWMRKKYCWARYIMSAVSKRNVFLNAFRNVHYRPAQLFAIVSKAEKRERKTFKSPALTLLSRSKHSCRLPYGSFPRPRQGRARQSTICFSPPAPLLGHDCRFSE